MVSTGVCNLQVPVWESQLQQIDDLNVDIAGFNNINDWMGTIHILQVSMHVITTVYMGEHVIKPRNPSARKLTK